MLLIQKATKDWTKSWLFLPALYRKSAKLFMRKLCQKRAHKQAYAVWNVRITASVCCAKRIALSFASVLHDRVVFFFLNNFADFSHVVWVKNPKILPSRWWRFQATSPIARAVYLPSNNINLCTVCVVYTKTVTQAQTGTGLLRSET